MHKLRVINRGVCISGFRAAGVKRGKYGVALIRSEAPAKASVMVTENRVKAAPLLISREHAEKEILGIIANSGNANAFTGSAGMEDARRMCSIAARLLGGAPENYLVASTGVIGRRMDIARVEGLAEEAAARLEASPGASEAAARAIMTTDTFPKLSAVEAELSDGTRIEVGGIAKGAGMIAPRLRHATMLCFLTTNARLEREEMDEALAKAVEQSFNRVVVDGDMSTNDMVVLLASGEAGNESSGGFQEALNFVAQMLAKSIARDGEGATKYIEVRVSGAVSNREADLAARAVVGSNLVKSAVFGGDPNWGRIIAALGYSGARVVPEKLSLYVGGKGDERGVCLVERGKPIALEGTAALKAAEEVFRQKEIYITAELNLGSGKGEAYGCDLTYEYVRINAEYTT
ncbi:bifunctional ornithine acetyltransferase/N-acetylglutamate synthase [Candidatus Pyrohabitans sp.]